MDMLVKYLYQHSLLSITYRPRIEPVIININQFATPNQMIKDDEMMLGLSMGNPHIRLNTSRRKVMFYQREGHD